MLKSLSIFTGNSNRALADEICKFVEIPLGRADAVADEDQRRVHQHHVAFARTAGRDHDLLALGQGQSPVAHADRGLNVGGRELVQGHRLGPAAVFATRRQTRRLELG